LLRLQFETLLKGWLKLCH